MFLLRILLCFPNIYRRNTMVAKFLMDLYILKNLGQGSSNKIPILNVPNYFLNWPSIAHYYVQI